MIEQSSTLLRLIAWVSPSFPTGGFSYSQGLETAYAQGILSGRPDLSDWVRISLETGPMWNDAIFCARSWTAAHDPEALEDLKSTALALANCAERYKEIQDQAAAFANAAQPWSDHPLCPDTPLPINLGYLAARNQLPQNLTVGAMLHSMVSNLVQVSIRLGYCGQQTGVTLLADFEDAIWRTAGRAVTADLDLLGSGMLRGDLTSMQHETQHSRIFRT